jgi:hypothetical protein
MKEDIMFKKTTRKKIIGAVLASLMLLTSTVSSFADSIEPVSSNAAENYTFNETGDNFKDLDLDLDNTYANSKYETTTVYVDDYEGNMIPVEVTVETKDIFLEEGTSLMLYSTTPKHRIGETRKATAYISNTDMGLPSFGASALSYAAKKKAAKLAAKAIAKKLGTQFLPGVGVVSFLLSGFAIINDYSGKNGVVFTLYLRYTRAKSNKDEYFTYDWSPYKVTMARY